MPLLETGYEFALNLLTDDTVGFNEVSILFDGLTETDTQTITWAAAAGNISGGSVGASVDLVFDITAGKTVIGVVLYHDTTACGTALFGTNYYFTNAGQFTLTSLVLSLA